MRKNDVSPSFHSFVCGSLMRFDTAMRKFATAAPCAVKRSSGSSVRFPTSVTEFSLITTHLPGKDRRSGLAGTNNLVPYQLVREPQDAVELGYRCRFRLEIGHHVVTLVQMV